MSGDRGISQDELLGWIEDELEPLVREDVTRRLALDPELDTWARGARADRLAVCALAEAEGAAAPAGLWREAMAEAERRVLLADAVEPARGPYRLRVTPVRLVAAAAVLIVASLGTIAPFLTGDVHDGARPGGLASAPSVPERIEAALPLTGPGSERARSGRSLAMEPMAADRTAPVVSLVSDSGRWASDPNGIVANRAMAGMGDQHMTARQPRSRRIPDVLPREWGMSLADAQRLAREGRLRLTVTADDPSGYATRLLNAVGARGRYASAGEAADDNGLASPVELLLTVPVDRVERALRLSAISADDVRLEGGPGGVPGAWASGAMWWGDSAQHEASVRVDVVPAGGLGRLPG